MRHQPVRKGTRGLVPDVVILIASVGGGAVDGIEQRIGLRTPSACQPVEILDSQKRLERVAVASCDVIGDIVPAIADIGAREIEARDASRATPPEA